MENQFVSLIIPTFEDWDSLSKCLESIDNLDYPEDLFETIVVNNNPSAVVPTEILNENIVLLEEQKPGSYSARNTGLMKAKGDIIAFTDSDCKVHSDWLIEIVSALKDCDLVGGNVKCYLENDINKVSRYYDLYNGFPQQYYVHKLHGSVTANLAVRKEVLDNIGFFDSELYSGGDIEWCQRAVKKGYNLQYNANQIVYHPARTLKELGVKKRRVTGGLFLKSGMNRWIYFFKKILSICVFPIRYFFNPLEQKRGVRLFRDSFYLELVALHESFKIALKKTLQNK